MEKVFELALKNSYRYQTSVGTINTEDLFKVKDEVLESLYLDLLKEKEDANKSSLFGKTTTKEIDNKVVENKITIIEYIAKCRKEEREAASKAKENAERKQKILEQIEKINDEQITSASKEELLKMLEEMN